MNQDFQHQHSWITPQNHKGLKCLHNHTYQCNEKQTGTYCPICHIYLCSSHKPKQTTQQPIEDWFIQQKQKYIQVKQLIKIIEKNFKGQGQQFKSGQFKGDWMYPGNNGIQYHIHYSNSGYIGHKSSSWSGNGRVCFQRIGKQYKSIQDIPQKQAVNQKARFLQFVRKLMEIIKSQYQ